MSKKNELVNVYNVVVYCSDVSYDQIDQMQKLLKTTKLKTNGHLTAKCDIEVNQLDFRKEISNILSVEDGAINLSFYEK